MKKILLAAFLVFLLSPALATHIVGGEFELQHERDYYYQLRLILYFDDFYGDPLAEDPWARVGIFSKKNDSLIATVTLNNAGSAYVNYTNPECTIEQLSTRRILYTSNSLFLSPNIYNDPAGYYVVWERCCRNNVIDNIVNPQLTAQTFYLEFPPVVRNGAPFINSSPMLFPPLSDYACVNREFYADFRGFDGDGDSLVYSLTTPWSGHTSDLQPALNQPLSQPYAPVVWQPGINVNAQVPGDPPLQISERGILKVNPAFEGLFVFAVKCEEFRNGVKIGEVRRDFQMLAISCHQPGSPPSAQLKINGSESIGQMDTLVVTGASSGCFQLYVTDPDSAEKITVRAFPVNFNAKLDELFRSVNGVITDRDDTLVLDLCLPACPLSDQRYAVVDVIAMDDECSVPLMDTVRLVVDYEQVLNKPPYFAFNKDTVDFTIPAGEIFALPVDGIDDDGSLMRMTLEANNFNLADFNVRFDPLINQAGTIKYNMAIDADCSKLSGSDTLSVTLLLKDTSECGTVKKDRLVVNFMINPPGNTPPVVLTDHDSEQVVLKIDEILTFPVSATDEDNDLINLIAFGDGFSLDDYGINFNPQSGYGTATSSFSWTPGCEVNINEKSHFRIYLVAEDNDVCHRPSGDTAVVEIELRRPDNRQPVIRSPINTFPFIQMRVGETLEFQLGASDPDGDFIHLDLVNRQELEQGFNIVFEPKQGPSPVNSYFSFKGECAYLLENNSPRTMALKFVASDQKCYNPLADTVTFTVNLADIDGKYEAFLPINVFTPNGDDKNQYFSLPDLPRDNCMAQFKDIRIYNRWGDLVFESASRDFAWSGENQPTGVYYYIIHFSSFVYKGHVSILK